MNSSLPFNEEKHNLHQTSSRTIISSLWITTTNICTKLMSSSSSSSSAMKKGLVLCTIGVLVGIHLHYDSRLQQQQQDEEALLAERRGLSLVKQMNLDSALEMIEAHYYMKQRDKGRSMSIDLGNGQCKVTAAVPADRDVDLFSTLIAGYPGSGKRVTFTQMEAITGLITGDDYNLSGNHDHVAYMKSSYPHHEGIWSWQNRMNQILLVVRNPRWALPSYATVLHEIDYAKTWQDAYERQEHVYSTRTPLHEWIAWRDARFHEEIHMWSWFIDFWMEGGLQRQYTDNHDLLYPSVGPTYDHHCALEDMDDCHAVAIVSYERMTHPSTGPQELEKIVSVLQGRSGVDDHILSSKQARQCVWTEIIMNGKGGKRINANRKGGPSRDMYTFTLDQMNIMEQELVRLRNKYSGQEDTKWTNHPTAQDLVGLLNEYIKEVQTEKARMNSQGGGTPGGGGVDAGNNNNEDDTTLSSTTTAV